MAEPASTRTETVQPRVRAGWADRDAQWNSYVQLAAAGDQQAFANLYDESSRIVFSVALRILGNPADAEEVTLDVYAQVWRMASKFSQSRGAVNAWIVMLARSRAIDRLRSRKRLREQEPVDLLMELAGTGPDPEQVRSVNESGERIRRAMEAISPEQKQAIELAYFSGFTQSELAEHLGEPLGTIKTRIRLGMMKMREQLAGSPQPAS